DCVHRFRGDARFLEVAVDDGARARAGLATDVGMLSQDGGQRAGFVREGVGRRAYDLQLVLAADLALERGKVRVAFYEAQVQRALGDALLDSLGIAYEQVRHHRRETRLEPADQLRQHVLAYRHARPDQERPGRLSAHLLQA